MSQPPPLPPTPPAPQQPLEYQPPAQWETRPLNWPAVLSVPAAILLPVLPFVSGVVAVILAYFGLQQTKTGEQRGRAWAKWGLGLGIANVVLGPIVIVAGVFALDRARTAARDATTMANMRQIGQGLIMYSVENKGFYPDSFDQTTKYLGGKVHTSLHGNPAKPAVILPSGLTSDYVYAKPARKINGVKNSMNTPIVYEPPAHFGGTRAPILFADGHVEMVRPPRLLPLIAQVDANAANPPK